MNRNENRWIKLYKQLEALWLHGGNPQQPHIRLTSGMHSSGFFNSGLIAEHPRILDEATQDLVCLLKQFDPEFNPILVDRVVGPAMGAITLAHDIARCLNGVRSNKCRSAYTEKEGDKMVFKRTTIRPGEHVLVCEDVITTGYSAQKTMEAVTTAGGIVLPYVLTLVNRSEHEFICGNRIIALINKPMPIWFERECPLCAAGSEAIRPKVDGNWQRLTATY